MLTQLYLGARVIYNDHSGSPCPATITKIYTPNISNSNLDLHVIGATGNASYARGKLGVPYGVNIIGAWQYPEQRDVVVQANDLPSNEEGLIYNATTDRFETEPVISEIMIIDGGTF